MIRKKSYKVPELGCAEEVDALKKALTGRPGIASLEFDVLNARMTVAYDDARTSPDMIVATVAEAGMSAVDWEERTAAETLWQRHGRLVAASLSGAFLLAGFLLHWVMHGSLVDAVSLAHGQRGHLLPSLALLLYAASVVAGAWFVAPRAFMSAAALRPDMNLLMTLAVFGAAAIGEWLEAATVAFLFSVSLLLEQWSVSRARRAISGLLDLSPPTARVMLAEGTEPVETPVHEVRVGSVIVVRSGERIPLDGQVLTGSSSVNQAPLTGESLPVPKGPGEPVYAGSINGEGTLELEVNRAAEDTTLARVIHMVQQSQAHRARSETWIERFALYYTPAMMVLAVGTALLPPLVARASWATSLYRGLVLLVIGCPCALVISTPASVVSALTSAARHGVLIKGGLYLEAAGRLKAVAVDKTGTLTYGKPEVQRVVPLDRHTPEEILAIAASVEADSVHPLAEAILRKATQQGTVVQRAKAFRAIHGKGAEGVVRGRRYWVGSHQMMHERGTEATKAHEAARGLEDAGHTVVAVGSEHRVCGLISIADAVRENAAQVVAQLHELGVRRVVMLTGDNEGTARSIAAATGVDEWHAALLPEDKVSAVKSLVQDAGQAAMIGDGVNDAPAMAAATLGIAMGAVGSDAAIETADVTLMSDEIARVPWLIAHSRRTLRIIVQNVGFSLAIKLAFVVMAFSGTASLWMAIAADMGASLLVTFNGLRLLQVGSGWQMASSR